MKIQHSIYLYIQNSYKYDKFSQPHFFACRMFNWLFLNPLYGSFFIAIRYDFQNPSFAASGFERSKFQPNDMTIIKRYSGILVLTTNFTTSGSTKWKPFIIFNSGSRNFFLQFLNIELITLHFLYLESGEIYRVILGNWYFNVFWLLKPF